MSTRAVVFAGQGAQSVGMGKDLAEAYPECRSLLDKAAAVLGYDLPGLCFAGPEDQLTRSDRCQPAIFAVSMACFTALKKELPGLHFAATAGLSLGEWSALHMAGALSYEDALKVLEARGRFMQEACNERPGGMVSIIGLERAAVDNVAAQAGVGVANINSPGQVVLSGPVEGIRKAEQLAKEAGAKRAVVLNVAGAFHSTLMASAAARLEKVLAGVAIRAPSVPVVSNVTGRPHGSPDEIRRTMVLQVTSPVQWISGIEWMKAQGVAEYIECGPGKVLSGLIKRIDGGAKLYGVQDAASLKETLAALKAQ